MLRPSPIPSFTLQGSPTRLRNPQRNINPTNNGFIPSQEMRNERTITQLSHSETTQLPLRNSQERGTPGSTQFFCGTNGNIGQLNSNTSMGGQGVSMADNPNRGNYLASSHSNISFKPPLVNTPSKPKTHTVHPILLKSQAISTAQMKQSAIINESYQKQNQSPITIQTLVNNSSLCSSSPTLDLQNKLTTDNRSPQIFMGIAPSQVNFQQLVNQTHIVQANQCKTAQSPKVSQKIRSTSYCSRVEGNSFFNNHEKNSQLSSADKDMKGNLVPDLQGKIMALLKENEKINELLRHQQDYITSLEVQMVKSQDDNKKQSSALLELTLKQRKTEQDKNQIEELYTQIVQERDLNCKHLLTDMEEKVGLLVEENNKLNDVIQDQFILRDSQAYSDAYTENYKQEQNQTLIAENQILNKIIAENKISIEEREKVILKLEEQLRTVLQSKEDTFNSCKQLQKELSLRLEVEKQALLAKKSLATYQKEHQISQESLQAMKRERDDILNQKEQLEEFFAQEKILLIEECNERCSIMENMLIEERQSFSQKQDKFMKEKNELREQFDSFQDENRLLAEQISDIDKKILNIIKENESINQVNFKQQEYIKSLEDREEVTNEQLTNQFSSSIRERIEDNLQQLSNRYSEEIDSLHLEIRRRTEDVETEKKRSKELEDQVANLHQILEKLSEESSKQRKYDVFEEEETLQIQKQYQQQLEFENNELKNKIEILEQQIQTRQFEMDHILSDSKNKDKIISEYQNQITNQNISQVIVYLQKRRYPTFKKLFFVLI